jgi:hypothetical protein
MWQLWRQINSFLDGSYAFANQSQPRELLLTQQARKVIQ